MSDSMSRHGGDRIAEVLVAQSVERLFTLCGGHVSPILAAAKARGLRIVNLHDEASAVFAADATARLTGRPGVAAVTAGPGITNTITALKNAQLAQSPLILLGGAAPTAVQGRGAVQDNDQRPLVEPDRAQPLAARALEVVQVHRVVDDAAGIGVLPEDPHRPRERHRPAHGSSPNSGSGAAGASGAASPKCW